MSRIFSRCRCSSRAISAAISGSVSRSALCSSMTRSSMREMSFQCRSCGEQHDELPMAFHAEMPQAWMEIPEGEEDARGQLGSDQCELDGERFFMRGLLR